MNASLQKADEKSAAKEQERKSRIIEDELLGLGDIGAMSRQVINKSARAAVAEIDELFRDKKWEDALALFYPVEEKMPELVGSPAADRVREKMAFALGQLKRFDEAITALEICLTAEPDNYFVHNSLAYTAYNSLYAAKNREIFLSGKPRKDRIDLAHRHFTAALALRPDSVTNCYREAMLFRQIEDKGTPALPLFLRAIANWENLSAEEKQARHQERKNYVKSLYQGASLMLENGNSGKAMEMIQRCLAEDKESNYLSLTFKYFAVGKIHFHRQQYEEAKQALVVSLKSRTAGPVDFVRELLARCCLALHQAGEGLREIERIPENSRRPYVVWTESDIRIHLGEFDRAKSVLIASAKGDHRSRHKTLVRLARLDYLLGNYPEVMKWAKKASEFFQEKWGTPYADGLFWEAAGALRCGLMAEARQVVDRLEASHPHYPDLRKLKHHLG